MVQKPTSQARPNHKHEWFTYAGKNAVFVDERKREEKGRKEEKKRRKREGERKGKEGRRKKSISSTLE